MNIKTMSDVAAEFARRNAAKAAKKAEQPPAGRQHTHCTKCGYEFGRTEPTCFDSRDVPICWDCSEGRTVT